MMTLFRKAKTIKVENRKILTVLLGHEVSHDGHRHVLGILIFCVPRIDTTAYQTFR